MRWLFIVVLALLVACILSLVWLNDKGRWSLGQDRTQDRTQGAPTQPSDAPLLPLPQTQPQQPGQ